MVYCVCDSKFREDARVISPVDEIAKFSLPTPERLYCRASPSWSATVTEATTAPISVVSLMFDPLV